MRHTKQNMRLILASTIVFACATAMTRPAFAAEKVAIILQENSGQTSLLDVLDSSLRPAARALTDSIAENFERLKTQLQFGERYARVHDLTDTLCTRANLLSRLKRETELGNTIDLFIYGHGNVDTLMLHGTSTLTGGPGGNIRSMLAEAGVAKFNLRLVYMCNCFGSTLNDDWMAIGATTSVGAVGTNYPEPQISNFVGNFVVNNMSAKGAADKAYSDSLPLWVFLPQALRNSSRPVVAGATTLRHTDTRLSVGESKPYTVNANKTHNFPNLFARKGEKYILTASASDEWKNGNTVASPNGYAPSIVDAARRHAEFNQMALLAEVFKKDNDPSPASYSGQFFKIGTSAPHTAAIDGYLCFMANDVLIGYGDNSGSITVTVKRVQ